jgi:hypothetical protein
MSPNTPKPVNPISALDGLPVMAKVAAVVGVPSAIAMYLVWILAGGTANAEQLRELDRKMNSHVERMEQLTRDRDEQLSVQTRLLRLVCQSVAQNESVKVECSR